MRPSPTCPESSRARPGRVPGRGEAGRLWLAKATMNKADFWNAWSVSWTEST